MLRTSDEVDDCRNDDDDDELLSVTKPNVVRDGTESRWPRPYHRFLARDAGGAGGGGGRGTLEAVGLCALTFNEQTPSVVIRPDGRWDV